MLDAHALRAALRQQHAAIASDDSRTSRTLRQAIESGDRDLTHRIASAFDQLMRVAHGGGAGHPGAHACMRSPRRGAIA